MVFRGGTERVSVVADKGGGGGEGVYRKLAADEGEGGKGIKRLSIFMLQPFIPQYQNAYSPYCSLYISLGANEENLFNNQELLSLMIIFSFLVT